MSNDVKILLLLWKSNEDKNNITKATNTQRQRRLHNNNRVH